MLAESVKYSTGGVGVKEEHGCAQQAGEHTIADRSLNYKEDVISQGLWYSLSLKILNRVILPNYSNDKLRVDVQALEDELGEEYEITQLLLLGVVVYKEVRLTCDELRRNHDHHYQEEHDQIGPSAEVRAPHFERDAALYLLLRSNPSNRLKTIYHAAS